MENAKQMAEKEGLDWIRMRKLNYGSIQKRKLNK